MKDKYQFTFYIYDRHVLKIGRMPDIEKHRLGSAAFVCSLDATELAIKEIDASRWRCCRTALVPPSCIHKTRFNGALTAILFLEPESIDYVNMAASMPNGDFQIMFDHIDEANITAKMKQIISHNLDADKTYQLLQEVIYGTGYDYKNEQKIDPRVVQILDLIKNNPAASYSMEHLAAMVNLSPTRFIHLFKEQTGVPIRRFRQWMRMKKAIILVADGKSLTEGAVEAGFTDSSHFSRAFKNMFGVTPSTIFNKSKKTKYFISKDQQ